MNYLKNFDEEKELFGPGTDLLISLLAILIMVLAIYLNNYRAQEAILEKIKEEQLEIVEEIAYKYQSLIDTTLGENVFGISTNSVTQNDIIIYNEITIQRITFGSNILFESDSINLKNDGKNDLLSVGETIKNRLNSIKEIQIQGHADPRSSKLFNSNLELAAHRAISVFAFFQDEPLSIDPAKYLMSISSFGEYKPVDRNFQDGLYNIDKIYSSNSTIELQNRNRRIEIVLIYREIVE